ncbi:phospho-N-acetylmuramoyl-pentapeptide-transferase [Microcella alkaliphila]|uniref:Phospho-N-acetylmuramoyl-pentapeptide-transferase n=1 Tax=Microcella alkaliphila TaxID=279828 RepID=A0A0U5BPG3_9MICO|nr:phospho-N-acetylmuramoyl-pentapeptide-transferase [Microcella alkaliphila]BAU32150.1 phospho-N-acetylmuramoyl-pentapeptide-transferase [Microcella alkaliphila]
MIALLFSGAFALAFTLLTTPLFVRLFKRIEWGQFIREDGPQTHHTKRGTPTMGGIIVVLGAGLGYVFGHLVAGEPFTLSGLLVLGIFVGLAVVGFIDDYSKVRNQRSLGLGGWAKIAGQVIVATAFALVAINFPDRQGLTPASTQISAVRDIAWLDFATFGSIGAMILFAIWVNIIVVSTSNAVNVADGLDGLATGASILSIVGYIIIAFWQFNQSCSNAGLDPAVAFKCYDVRDSLDLAIVAAAIAASLIGFLWWNTSPAQIFLGDTGSLAIGGALAALAILTHTQLLLILMGGLFLIVTGSVIVQRAYFKITGGKRIFLMSPLHHHFELKGWAEVTVVVRFWLIGGLFVAVGVGLFYLEWISA